ncbi:hypothetical protein L207DRAFT_335346 [Hyaloscypha variabilis F]|uniref:Secreted protein n=1 Tax=Hyaloscypha variabilis (strain UAMH 11265 / GT02V1 / F) TaxID=1149755 RepID=A0A2J6RNV3_HYAVF|nr:hypothetical protein L207DRAFT_335346 [Hyaloscypha variabilis F]
MFMRSPAGRCRVKRFRDLLILLVWGTFPPDGQRLTGHRDFSYEIFSNCNTNSKPTHKMPSALFTISLQAFSESQGLETLVLLKPFANHLHKTCSTQGVLLENFVHLMCRILRSFHQLDCCG